MKLIRARVQNYRSVEDSGEFDIGRLTCMVGKNEAGKTTLLNALRGLRSTPTPFEYDQTRDYPRRFATRFNERHPKGTAEVARGWYELDDQGLAEVESRFGPGCLRSSVVEVHYGFGYQNRIWQIPVDEGKSLRFLCEACSLTLDEQKPLEDCIDGNSAVKALIALGAARTPAQGALLQEINKCRDNSFPRAIIDILDPRMPKFFYTSHFERMSGEISVDQLQRDKAANKPPTPSDRIFLDFLDYAGTNLEELQQANKREDLKAKCEAAGNDITDEIFTFWSQNSALEVVIDFDTGKSGDPVPFNAGTVAQVRVRNAHHKATLPLSERSAGFVWFFSFLAQFKQLKKTAGNAIILLDEPGLTLHGKAQGDLLRYMVERLLPEHQVIYTTHSPFMVPPDRLADVKIVEDVILRDQQGRVTVKGTKVRSDVLEVDEDTLFPLQGALGYELTQTLFVGPNVLLVEGTSDKVFLEVLSGALRKRGKHGLDRRWTVTPCEGITKIAPFVRLFGSNRMNMAVLSDVQKGDLKKIEDLRRSNLLKAGHFYTVADFLDQSEADIEDIFDADVYVRIVNNAFNLPASHAMTVSSLASADSTAPRIVKKTEAHFKKLPADIPEFSHYACAEWLMRNPGFLDDDTSQFRETLDRAQRVLDVYNGLLK